jgi:hypothetical protein
VAIRAYSERFLQGEGVGVALTYTVPEGKRALVRSIAYAAQAVSGGQIWLRVHGVYTWFAFLPATGGGLSVELRQVAYERETITVSTYVVNIGFHVAGYLFDDPIGRPPAASQLPGAESSGPAPEIEWPPWT